jgi:AcrR family transcriptional regulator
LIGLAREKPYDAIAVKEILDRADVGRSTFYTHFRDKDELLDGSIHEMIRGTHDVSQNPDVLERIVAFSLPILEHIDRHRQTAGPKMARNSRLVIHQHLERVLADRIADDLGAAMCRGRSPSGVPAELIAGHVAATFVLVLNWWVERDTALMPAEVDERFRALVLPALRALMMGPAH